MVVPIHASENALPEVLNHLGFANVTEVDVETFPAGIYNITLYAEFAGYHNENELSYYEVGNTSYILIFAGPEGGSGNLSSPLSKTIFAFDQFGFSLLTPDDYRYFSENTLNVDGQQHMKVYKNLDDPTLFLIGFEDMYEGGDMDFDDLVFSLEFQSPRQVIPEVPLGTILSLLGMLIALICFARFKHANRKKGKSAGDISSIMD